MNLSQVVCYGFMGNDGIAFKSMVHGVLTEFKDWFFSRENSLYL